MSRAWYDAAFPQTATVLKVKLRPYSVGHDILLRRYASPLIPEFSGPVPTPDDLVLAVLICSQDYRSAAKIEYSPFLWWPLRLWRWVLGTPDWYAETAAFESYREHGAWCPEIAVPATSDGKAQSPGPFRILAFLMGRLGMSERQALDYPLSRANVLFFAWADLKGEAEYAGEGTKIDALFKKLEQLEEEGKWDF